MVLQEGKCRAEGRKKQLNRARCGRPWLFIASGRAVGLGGWQASLDAEQSRRERPAGVGGCQRGQTGQGNDRGG